MYDVICCLHCLGASVEASFVSSCTDDYPYVEVSFLREKSTWLTMHLSSEAFKD